MSITDELREWVRNHVAELNIGGVDRRDLKEIADRIDERHRKALEKVAAMADEPSLDALERRIDRLDGMLDGMGKGAASRIEAIEGRVSAIERKLNHRGAEE